MPRIPELDRLPMFDAHTAHYTEANIINGTPIELEPGFGLPQLLALRSLYVTASSDVALLEQTTLPNLRSQRDAIWGITPEDINGIWIRLTQYKKRVKTRLGKRHSLTRTVPNIGEPTIERYLVIARQFLNHWALVNAALPSPLLLGSFGIATMQAAHDALGTKLTDIEAAVDLLLIRREQAEQLFGDEDEDERELTSIVARLLLYHSEIEARFPGQPIADSLPPIFPDEGGPSLPTFPMNYVTQPGGALKVFYTPPDPPLTAATVLFLKEGGLELSQPVLSVISIGTAVHTFNGITLVDELDKLELRNAAGLTLARGVRDPSLPEPT